MRLHRADYDDGALVEWARCVSGQTWSEAYVFFKHDDDAGGGSGPTARCHRVCESLLRLIAISREREPFPVRQLNRQ